MKLLYGLVFMLLATTVRGAEFPIMDHLDWDDPVWYSGDGHTWHNANFLTYVTTADCKDGGVDSDGMKLPADCSGTKSQVAMVWYDKPLHPEGMQIAYITPDDPSVIPPPSKAELYGLLTRLENLINATEPRAAFSTAANMMADRASLQRRIDAIREILKNE